MNRKFGIEIEAYNVDKTALARALNAAGILCAVEGYNHQTRGHWKIVSDGSLQGYNTFELVSPILEGDNGLMQVEIVCQVLKRLDAKVNTSCGLHVHIDARDIDVNGLKRVSKMWMKYESCFDALVTPSRRNNRWAAGLRCKFANLDAAFLAIDATQTRAGIAYAMNSDGCSTSRYHKLNLESLQRHGTIEFRQHQGTVDGIKITNWVKLVGGFVQSAIAAKTIRKVGADKFENLLNVLPNAKDKAFFKARRAKLAVAA